MWRLSLIRQRLLQRLGALVCSLIAISALVVPALAQEPSRPNSGPARNAATRQDASAGFVPVWVLTLAPTEAWPGPLTESGSFGSVPLRTPLQVLAPQESGRLYVFNPRTNNVAWVDAPAVAPIPEPTGEDLEAYLTPPPFEPWWAMPFRQTVAWSGPESDATEVGRLRQWLYLNVVGPEENGRVPTVDLRTQGRAYVELSDVGLVGAPPED